MTRQALIRAFKRLVEPELEKLGFEGKKGHFVRRTGGVTHVVELQHSIYGGRITANLGLDLDFLKPLVRWIAQPSIGPHAHDATRWVRIGLVRPEHADCWWSFDADTEDGCGHAATGCGRAILDHGISWLETEGTPQAFRRWAEAKLERSKTSTHPNGSFLDLRMMAAVLAWNGEITEARRLAERARACWAEERERMVAARADYRRKNPNVATRVCAVPDLVAELFALIDETTERHTPASDPPSRRRPRSVRMRSQPA